MNGTRAKAQIEIIQTSASRIFFTIVEIVQGELRAVKAEATGSFMGATFNCCTCYESANRLCEAWIA